MGAARAHLHRGGLSPRPALPGQLSRAMAAALLALHAALAAHPESAWDERVDPACCPYPEHDPRESMWKAAAQRLLSIQHAPPQRQVKL